MVGDLVPRPGRRARFAEAVHARYPNKLLAYNCSPSFNWAAKLDAATIAAFQRELGAMGYKFQFVTLAGFHALNHGMFELAAGYRDRGMAAYSHLQQAEFASEAAGYTATRHQREVGTGYFDQVSHGHHRRRSLDHRLGGLHRGGPVQIKRKGSRLRGRRVYHPKEETMYHRTVDTLVHQLRAGRDETPKHDDLRRLYDEAIEKMSRLADALYKKARAQIDENLI